MLVGVLLIFAHPVNSAFSIIFEFLLLPLVSFLYFSIKASKKTLQAWQIYHKYIFVYIKLLKWYLDYLQ